MDTGERDVVGCCTYLEEFHIPYVHAELSNKLDYSAYHTETYAYSSLQLGVARSGEQTFELPPDHPDRGTKMAAYYYWLFPNLMFNVYPWGLSVNVVYPIGADKDLLSLLRLEGSSARRGRGLRRAPGGDGG